jgi:hypothetical protein
MAKKQENVNPETEPVEEQDPKNPFETFVYHQRRALEETGKALEALLPEGFREHGGEAGREFVKGFKALVDAAITEIEKATSQVEEVKDDDGSEPPSTTGKTKVRVQVD